MGNKRYKNVRRASDSTTQITFTYKDVVCKERLKIVPSDSGLEEANNKLQAVKDAIKYEYFDYATSFPKSNKRHKFETTSGVEFGTYLKKWYKKELSGSLRTSTMAGYSSIVNTLADKKDGLGSYHIEEIQPDLVRSFLTDYTYPKGKKPDITWQKLTTKTIKNYRIVLNGVLDHAQDKKIIHGYINPLRGMKVIKGLPSQSKEAINPLLDYEMNLILNECGEGQLRNILSFAIWTGVRPAELVAITWRDVSWKEKKIWIKRSRGQRANGHNEKLKTGSAYRWIKILPDVEIALKEQKKYTYDEKKSEIFHNPNTGKRWLSKTLYENFKRVLLKVAKEHDIPYRYLYQTRHTFASMMVGKKESLNWVADRMGHASPKQTLDTYSKYQEEADPNAGMAASDAFSYNPEKVDELDGF